jgi:hypothetical protein
MAQLWVPEHYNTDAPRIAGIIGPLRRECSDASGWQIKGAAPVAAGPPRILPVANPVAAHYIAVAGLLSASGANSPGPYRS